MSRQAQRSPKSSGDGVADNEEDGDRGGQHDEPQSKDKDRDGHRHVSSREQSPDNSGYKCYLSTCTDVVIDVVISKTSAYCRLQRTKEYTKANYSLRAKSQTSSPPRREDSDNLVSTITQACCENNTVMEVKSMKSQNRCAVKLRTMSMKTRAHLRSTA